MNSYERIMAALELREPDRVPILEWIIDPKVIRALCPKARNQTDFEEMMGLDAVSYRPHYSKISENADGSYVDEWGVLYKPGPEVINHPIKGPIQTEDDLKNYVPPDPHAPHRLAQLPDLVRRFKGKKAIIIHHRAAFMWAGYVNGLENLLENFLLAPKFVHRLMDKVLEVNIQLAQRAIEAGADVVMLGDDYASSSGPMVSPELFREFILPRLKKMVDAIHEVGGKVIKHSDGNLWPILDMIVNTGVDAINPIEPVAGMDIGEVKQKYGRRVCLIGNIDCSHLLSEGSVEEVEQSVRECIRKASPGGGHIIASSNSIHSSVKPENYLAMIEAAKKFGRYPL